MSSDTLQRQDSRVICVMGRVLDQDDGLGVYADNLLRSLARLDPETRYVVVLRTSKYQDRFKEHHNIDTILAPAARKLWWDQVTVPRIARQVDADLIFNPKFSIPFLTTIPSTFVLHDADWYVNPQNYPWWDQIYIRVMLPLYIRRARHVLAISRTIIDELRRHVRVDLSKVTVSHAAPSPHFLRAPDDAALEEFSSRYELPERFILTVARVEHTGHADAPYYPGCNLERLVDAYRLYRKRGGTLPLVFVGRDIREYLNAQGIEERDGFRFTGFVPHEQIHLAYALAELFVLVKLYESFSFPLVEAMAMGCPVVAPSTGACPEVAEDAAILVDPTDVEGIAGGMLTVGGDQELRVQLARRGKERARQFEWDEVARKTLAGFDRARR